MENNLDNNNNNLENQQNEHDENGQSVTLSQEELDKRIQSAADKVRTEYSKQVKELKAKIKELTPTEKSDVEKELENLKAELARRDARSNLLDNLEKNGVSRDFADYFKEDADIESFAKVYQNVIGEAVQNKIKESGFQPTNHPSGQSLTKEDFVKMSMVEKEQLFNENRELYNSLR